MDREREVPESYGTGPRPRSWGRIIAHSLGCSCFPGRVSSLLPSQDMECHPSTVVSMEHLPDFSKTEGSYLFPAGREKHPSEPP